MVRAHVHRCEAEADTPLLAAGHSGETRAACRPQAAKTDCRRVRKTSGRRQRVENHGSHQTNALWGRSLAIVDGSPGESSNCSRPIGRPTAAGCALISGGTPQRSRTSQRRTATAQRRMATSQRRMTTAQRRMTTAQRHMTTAQRSTATAQRRTIRAATLRRPAKRPLGRQWPTAPPPMLPVAMRDALARCGARRAGISPSPAARSTRRTR